jgi:hypothetical protein
MVGKRSLIGTGIELLLSSMRELLLDRPSKSENFALWACKSEVAADDDDIDGSGCLPITCCT